MVQTYFGGLPKSILQLIFTYTNTTNTLICTISFQSKWSLFELIDLFTVRSLSHSTNMKPGTARIQGGGPRVVVRTAAFHARVRGSVPGLGSFKEIKMFLPHPRVKVSIVESFRDREVACSASDRQGSNFESCVWRTVSSQSSHQPLEVLLAQFSLYVHKGGLKPDSFHFACIQVYVDMLINTLPCQKIIYCKH